MYVSHGVSDVLVAKEFHDVVDIAVGLMAEHGCFPVAEGVEMDFIEPGVFQFSCQ